MTTTTSTLSSSSQSQALAPRPARNDGWMAATQPTRLTRFWRTFLPWQLVRFVIINLKMFRIIWLSHRTHRRAKRVASPAVPATAAPRLEAPDAARGTGPNPPPPK